jgi:hypothetical protein
VNGGPKKLGSGGELGGGCVIAGVHARVLAEVALGWAWSWDGSVGPFSTMLYLN